MRKEIDKIPCLYCGEKTDNRKFIINPKAREELPCCSTECMQEVRKFIDWDSHNRMKLYIMLFAFVILNLIFIGFNFDSRWRNLPLLFMATAVYFYPLIFTRYIRYQGLGIKKTVKVTKVISLLIAAFSIILIVNY
ncbi:hypothetical protein A500_14653 [Clostridium sartagoforme AAU1]|uniref:Uncharacterized protein n=1 Tax=Clostridium sartagoforme AAU1 TaxID=1202534 RepID=R9BVI1_9CLOT|nr:hypothetical protein [Clostridium sartagoforme]EOR21037.1 hypothetical protein A500_14653 [Clostridium sartagoforme AAU1]